MNEIIRKRKSVRKYDLTPLDATILEAVRAEINNLKPLYPNIKFSIEIVSKAKGMFGIKAPHYLIFTSDEQDGYLENIGFVGQQLDLYFSANGMGACWLGASKSDEKLESDLPHVIALAFGKPSEPLYREISAFKRKPLSAISEGSDPRLEAARLAPSAMNMQNWFFIATNGKIHCYLRKTNPLLGLIYGKMNRIDLGIAVCHIEQGAPERSRDAEGGFCEAKLLKSENFSFAKMDDVPIRKELIYVGTVVFSSFASGETDLRSPRFFEVH